MDQFVVIYPWIKAFHIISIIAWMAGLLYLPRLYVYHAGSPVGSVQSATFKLMEKRLYLAIIVPAMIAALVFGVILIMVPGVVDFRLGWFHAKLTLVLVLFVFTHLLGVWRRAFAEDRNRHSGKFFRMVNEIPTVLMIIIVILVVVKPF